MTIELDTNITKAKAEPAKISSCPQIFIPGGGAQVVNDYNEVNLLEMDDVKQAKVESWIAKTIGTDLIDHYPNRQWGVQVDVFGQMVVIMCPSVSQEKGYYLSMEGRSLKDLVTKARWAAGEILERYNVSRARLFNPDHLETLARDAKDEVISSDAAPEPIHKVLEE